MATDWLKDLIPDIRAQIAEKMQGAETVNIAEKGTIIIGV